MRNINWGILSTGTIAKKFATTINQLSYCGSLAAVASRHQEKAEHFANDFNIPKVYSSYI